MAFDLFSVKDRQKGFTLMELLVVIAVFGLISSIIFVISRDALDNTRISKGLQFSQHLQNSLGSWAVGVWPLDEGTESTANDLSGWGSHGALTNEPAWITDTPSGNGYALSFDGDNDYVAVSNYGSVVAGVGEVTVEAWLKPGVSSGNDDFVWFATTGDKRITVHFPWGEGIIWQFGDFATCSRSITLDPSWVGVWAHYVFFASESGGYSSIYRNGIEVATGSCTTNPLPASTTTLYIGGRGYSGYGFQGSIDEVRIYNANLTSAQIRLRYYAGLERLLAKGRITEEEYQQQLALR
jgi:prepilin-type N-terminal cleavage/methylation domain-containing protein